MKHAAWQTVIRLELRSNNLPVVDELLAHLLAPENTVELDGKQFKALVSKTVEGYLGLLREHYDLILRKQHEQNLQEYLQELVIEAFLR